MGDGADGGRPAGPATYALLLALDVMEVASLPDVHPQPEAPALVPAA